MSIVAFEERGFASAFAELRALGEDFLQCLFEQYWTIKTQIGIHERFQVYDTFHDVGMYRALIGNKFAIYAVEVRELDDVKVTVMFAGQYGVRVRDGEYEWDGLSDDNLREGILQARAVAHFREWRRS